MVTKQQIKSEIDAIMQNAQALRKNPYHNKKEMRILNKRLIYFKRINNYISSFDGKDLNSIMLREKSHTQKVIDKYKNEKVRYDTWLSMNKRNINSGNARDIYEKQFIEPLQEKLEFILIILGEKSLP